jgi:hypothetical protein
MGSSALASLGNVLLARRVFPGSSYRRQEDRSEFPCFLDQSQVVLDSGVAQVFQAVDALVGFLEDDSELGLEFRTRSTAPCSPVIRAN